MAPEREKSRDIEARTAAPGSDEPRAGVARLFGLSLLAALVAAWFEHHLAGSPVFSWIVRLATVLFAGSFVWLSKVVHGKDASPTDPLRRVISWWLRGARLEALALVLLVLLSQVSSVTVIAGSGPPPEQARLVQETRRSMPREQEEPFGGTKQVRFLALAGPFGVPYRLEVDGYRPRSLDLYPWVGTRVRVEDLVPSPSLLIRIPPNRLGNLRGGEVELYALQPDGEPRRIGEPVPTSSGGTVHGAIHYYFGRRPEVPDSMRSLWLVELAGNSQQGEFFGLWSQPLAVALAEELPNGSRLRACFHNASGEPLAELEFSLSDQMVIDSRLEPR